MRCHRMVWFSFLFSCLLPAAHAAPGDNRFIDTGIAVRDITPPLPIWLAGYAARKRPADRIDQPLMAQALALRNQAGERFVFVSIDNCEVSHAFNEPNLKQVGERFSLKSGAVMIVSSHTHSAPVLAETLVTMYDMAAADQDRVNRYSEFLRSNIVELVGAALGDFRPSLWEEGSGMARFAMNRRVYHGDKVDFGENPDGPVIRDVPVLRISETNGAVRAIVFGYSCHGTSIAGDDFYAVSPDYMGYARQQIEAVYPKATAIYLTGMGADSNPAPRGTLLNAKRHGLELAGAVMGVLDRPMRPVRGPFRYSYLEVTLPLQDPPGRAGLERDMASSDVYVKRRAEGTLKALSEGKAPVTTLSLPLAAIRLGDDLTFLAMGGEVVVDYGIQLKRLFAADHPWLVGYAYEVPCYIPSIRILKEGGYEADSSLIYYGLYGPFQTRIEEILLKGMEQVVSQARLP